MGKKYIDNSWDFIGEDTKDFTHIYHTYPAMMIPQIVRKLMNKYQTKNMELIFDPYMGSGTTLVEARLRGLNVIGTDLNPLARLIGKAKTNLVESIKLKNEIDNFKNLIYNLKTKMNYKKFIPEFSIRDNWFKEKTIIELGIIKMYIEQIEEEELKDFFLVSFTEVVRNSSLTRRGEFKLYKIKEEKRDEFDPKPINMMVEKLSENLKGYIEFEKKVLLNKKTFVKIYDFNTVENIPNEIIKNNSVDMVITSPPYGDSRTTVAYGQFSRLANEWLGYKEAQKIDSELMGGKKVKELKKFEFAKLDNIIDVIKERDLRRAKEVYSFYNDYQLSINNISKKLRHNGIVIYVVGNRRVSDIELPTDEITKYFFEQNNFEHLETIIRNIPNKRMPSKTSPTNKTGEKVSTMTNEYIVIMKKKAREE